MLFNNVRQPPHGKTIEYHRGAIRQTRELLIHLIPGNPVRAWKLPGQPTDPGSATGVAQGFHELADIPVAARVLFRITRNNKLQEARFVRFRHGSLPRQCGIPRG